MSEIYIGESFLGDCFHCYCQEIIPALAKEFLIPYNVTQKHREYRSSVKWSHLGQIPNFKKIDLGQLLSNK